MNDNEFNRRLIAEGIVEVAAGPQKVKCALDDAAKAAIGIELGDNYGALRELEDEYLVVRREYGNKIKAKKEALNELVKELKAGETTREVPCTAIAYIGRGELVVTRDDTGEEVEKRTLTAREIGDYNQLRLALDMAAKVDDIAAQANAQAEIESFVQAAAAPTSSSGTPEPGEHRTSKQAEPKRMGSAVFTAEDLDGAEPDGSYIDAQGETVARWKLASGRFVFVAGPVPAVVEASADEAMDALDEVQGEEEVESDDDGPSYGGGYESRPSA